jgi:hypothetical protein
MTNTLRYEIPQEREPGRSLRRSPHVRAAEGTDRSTHAEANRPTKVRVDSSGKELERDAINDRLAIERRIGDSDRLADAVGDDHDRAAPPDLSGVTRPAER